MSQPIQLQFQRFEFKYHLPASIVGSLKADLIKNGMQLDPYVLGTKKQSYPVTSLYFDNAAWGCYWDKEAGTKDRAKLRYRIYNTRLQEDDTIFLELKEKHDALVSKKRIIVPRAAYNRHLLTESASALSPFFTGQDRSAWRKIVSFAELNCLLPRLLVSYWREPLVWEYNDRLRITFDHDIASAPARDLSGNYSLFPLIPGKTIMEVKYNDVLPFWFEGIAQKYDLAREPFSKYGNGVLVGHRFMALPNL